MEQDRSMFARIRIFLDDYRAGPIIKLHVQREIPNYLLPDDDLDPEHYGGAAEVWDTLYTGNDIYRVIIERNSSKLRAAAPNLLVEGDLGKEISPTDTVPQARVILDGSFNLNRTEKIPEMLDILDLLKRPANWEAINNEITEESFVQSIRCNTKKSRLPHITTARWTLPCSTTTASNPSSPCSAHQDPPRP